MNHTIDNQTIISVIRTLKSIKVRGYDSMDRIVGLVMLFESILNEQPPEVQEQPQEEVK